jgi:septal ring factor EnvC (AmiA/AmiB activator)
LLGALERLARLPPEAMIALPVAPQDTLRSAILLRAAVPQLELQATALRRDIEALAVVRDEIIAKRADQQAQARALGEERARLGALLARKAALENQTLAERQKAIETADKLAGEATDLRELLVGIAADRKTRELAAREVAATAARAAETGRGDLAQAPSRTPVPGPGQALQSPPAPSQVASLAVPPLGTFSQARGRLAFPAQGRMVQAFGERLSTGGEARGMTLETQPAAQIVAPYDGQVVFAGPFRDYGQLLIIEHGEGYHMLLAGFERIDSAVNQTLLAGEPVGVMPAAESSRLYIELRQGGRPINPLPWLATPIGKVSG